MLWRVNPLWRWTEWLMANCCCIVITIELLHLYRVTQVCVLQGCVYWSSTSNQCLGMCNTNSYLIEILGVFTGVFKPFCNKKNHCMWYGYKWSWHIKRSSVSHVKIMPCWSITRRIGWKADGVQGYSETSMIIIIVPQKFWCLNNHYRNE